jgi:iron complex transport system ATP-binding protein
MSVALTLHGVTWRTPAAPVLTGVSLAATGGEFIAVMGRNGAGKSTLLDIIGGLRRPSEGTVLLAGRALHSWAPIERAGLVAHLPQLTRDALPFTVAQTVAMGRYPHAEHWFESAADLAASARAMRRAQCDAWRDRPMAQLSAGERQRALLAACLAQEASVLLMDEPSTFMDVDQQLHCFTLLAEEAAAARLCIAVTHDPNLALKFCSRLVLLADGSIVFDGPTAQALEDTTWLRALSPRLSVIADRDDRPWIAYR